jgi:hypothetical protein
LASESNNGNLALKRITSPDDIDYFIEKSRTVLGRSWKSHHAEGTELFTDTRCAEYFSLAKHGLMRSYVLIGNDEPIAFILGFQWNNIYHYSNIAYDLQKSALSPGTVLFYLMLEDLHIYDKPEILNFGIGDSLYKRRFGTDNSVDCSVSVIKSTLFNIVKYFVIKRIGILKNLVKKHKANQLLLTFMGKLTSC